MSDLTIHSQNPSVWGHRIWGDSLWQLLAVGLAGGRFCLWPHLHVPWDPGRNRSSVWASVSSFVKQQSKVLTSPSVCPLTSLTRLLGSHSKKDGGCCGGLGGFLVSGHGGRPARSRSLLPTTYHPALQAGSGSH